MDLTMSIASASISLSEFKTQQAVDIAMMKKVMDIQEVQALSLIESIPEVAVAMPPSDHIIDVLV